MPSDIRGDRLSPAEVESNFADLHPLLSKHEAVVEADRCYFCHDAPCVTACPTGIDIPLFIRQILTDNASGSAKTILSENILGGMCARVCPTETLCEQACVREIEQKPVRIGELQRYATDHLMEKGTQPFERAAPTGKTIAVVGAGPAGLSCAHRLAMLGHDVTIFEAKEKGGGLNEYGIAAYKAVDEFAQKELDFVLSIGGVELKNGMALGRDVTLDSLVADFDA
ncbi:MAG: FAD-dependent oxidoreductase, partial [Nisaea sp.]